MKSTQYSDKVLDHFRNPRNVGTLEGQDVAVGRVGNPVCGDLMEIYIKVRDNVIEEIKFKTFGCGSAIATASMITELARGKTIDEALQISRKEVADELDGLPPVKMHCSNLAADALHNAIENYLSREKSAQKSLEKRRRLTKRIKGEKEFLHRGVYHELVDLSTLKGKRVLVLDRGATSIEVAIDLTGQTGRVIFLTGSKEISAGPELKKSLKQSDVKILYESEILEIKGTNDVEKVLIHDLNEDEEYELFVDSIIMLQKRE
ncbi:nitrogen fixation protein NifU [candidate division TA06 bacterium DG_26]|uniref:Nitrogen fixation protein NifU n=1 Tax=candidate division TA06 bacterium DG_26 TaxID=1703771 RepID=A0A0S7WEH3_UNCT6|nr:MAG: nitrogen fixation protein NifU [candidate division TA06 bacterium DG_26]